MSQATPHEITEGTQKRLSLTFDVAPTQVRYAVYDDPTGERIGEITTVSTPTTTLAIDLSAEAVALTNRTSDNLRTLMVEISSGSRKQVESYPYIVKPQRFYPLA